MNDCIDALMHRYIRQLSQSLELISSDVTPCRKSWNRAVSIHALMSIDLPDVDLVDGALPTQVRELPFNMPSFAEKRSSGQA